MVFDHVPTLWEDAILNPKDIFAGEPVRRTVRGR
jgi:hypothetical protein